MLPLTSCKDGPGDGAGAGAGAGDGAGDGGGDADGPVFGASLPPHPVVMVMVTPARSASTDSTVKSRRVIRWLPSMLRRTQHLAFDSRAEDAFSRATVVPTRGRRMAGT